MDTEQKNILDGVIDLHVHTAPDVIRRACNDLELTDAAVHTGARSIVIKGHHCGTRLPQCFRRLRRCPRRKRRCRAGGHAGFLQGQR